MATFSSDLFALDIVVDSLKIDSTREIVPIPAMAFRFLAYPMQIVHLVPPEKIHILQFADESVLLSTLQSDSDTYSFKAGKSCMFEATFDQLQHAFSTSSRLLYLVLLDFYGHATPNVKAMASLDMMPLFEELKAKSKRFQFQRPCCAEANQHTLPLYSRRQLTVCGEVRLDVRLYFLGPRRLASEDFRHNFETFALDTSLKSVKNENPQQDQKENQKPACIPVGKTISIAQPVQLVQSKRFAQDMSHLVEKTDVKVIEHKGEENYDDEHGDFDVAVQPEGQFIIHEPTRFRCSPLRFDQLEIVDDKKQCREKPRASYPSFIEESFDASRPAVHVTFRRQLDKACQSATLVERSRSRNSKSPSRRYEFQQPQQCRHGKQCFGVKCRFQRSGLRAQSPYYPRPLSKQECERVKHCYTKEYCEASPGSRRFRGSWKRETPVARVPRGITPSPPPVPFWYLGKSRPKVIEKYIEVPVPVPRQKRKKQRSAEQKAPPTKLVAEIGVNTEGTTIVYENERSRSPVRIIQPNNQAASRDNDVSTLVSQPNDRLEDLVAEAMASFLVKQLQISSAKNPAKPKETVSFSSAKPEPAKEPVGVAPSPVAASTEKPKSVVIASKPALARRHTLAQLQHIPSVSEHSDESDPEIEHAMSSGEYKSKKPSSPDKEEHQISPVLGTVPDLPQYFERRESESDESAHVKTPSQGRSRLNRSVSDYNDDTFDSESASGGIPSPEPFQRPNMARRFTVDLSGVSSITKASLSATTPSSFTPSSAVSKGPVGAKPTLARRATAAELQSTPQQKSGPTFIIGDDGKLQAH